MNSVEAVNKNQINLIHTLLINKFGQIYADVWKVGVNMSLRIGDLLNLKYEDFDIENRTLKLYEQKTKKSKSIRLNKTVIEIFNNRKELYPNDIWLFQVHSNRMNYKPISRVSVSRVFKEAGDMFKLKINTHSMRKSRGMAMFNDGVSIEKISKVLNHSNTSSTMFYLGITQETIMKTYDDYEL